MPGLTIAAENLREFFSLACRVLEQHLLIANEAHGVVRLIMTVVDNQRWAASPHRLACRTDSTLVYYDRRAEKSRVRRIALHVRRQRQP